MRKHADLQLEGAVGLLGQGLKHAPGDPLELRDSS
jgi:hypothetical protein